MASPCLYEPCPELSWNIPLARGTLSPSSSSSLLNPLFGLLFSGLQVSLVNDAGSPLFGPLFSGLQISPVTDAGEDEYGCPKIETNGSLHRS